MPKKAGGQVRVTFDHIERVLDAMIQEDRQTDVPMIYGPPGIGKTEFVEAWVAKRQQKEPDFSLRSIILSQYDPTELKGFPYVDSGGDFRFSPIKTFPRKGPAVIFFDELSTSNKEVQNVTLRLFSQHHLGDYYLPPRVYMIGASNHVHDTGVFAHKLSTPMKTRLATYFVEVRFDVWKKWALAHNVEASVIYFLQRHQDFLIQIDADVDSMPCPRTWVNLSRQIQRMRKAGYTDTRTLLPEMIGRVGGTAAGEYMNYLELYSKVDVERLLKDGKFPSNIGEIGGDYAIMGAVLGTLKDPNYKITANICKNFIKCLGKMKREFSVCLLGDLIKGTEFMEKMRKALRGSPERKEYENLLDDYVKLLKDN
jgi:hypothetical protein